MEGAFADVSVFHDGAGVEFAIGAAGWIILEEKVGENLAVEGVEGGEGLDEGESHEGLFVGGAVLDLREGSGIEVRSLPLAEMEKSGDGVGGKRWLREKGFT